jgi:putative transposase
VRLSGLSFRLDPTHVQAGLLTRAAGARRFSFNQAIARIHANSQAWAAQRDAGVEPAGRVRPPSAVDLRAAWKADRPHWHAEVSSWVYDFACREAATAHGNFLAGRARFPRFAKKGGTRERFTIIGRDALLVAGTLTLPKIGMLRIAAPDPGQAKLRRLVCRGRARVTSVTVARHADGTRWAACKVERQLGQAHPHPNLAAPVVGVDRGVKTAAVAADAEGTLVAELHAGRHLRSAAGGLARAQRTVSRRTVRGRPGSKNRSKAVAMVGRLHEKVAARRTATLHTFTSRLARAHPVIVLETLTTKNLMANHRLAGAIADQGWGELGRQLTYKTAWRGGTVLSAPRFFPSSKTCSGCGAVKPKLPLAERTYRCDVCGLVCDRDVNAAANLAAWGEHQQGTCACAGRTRVRDPHPAVRSGGEPNVARRHACGGRVSGPPAHAGGPVLPGEAGTSRPRTRVA